eukprot:279417-Karenia_brevis.AAC.1
MQNILKFEFGDEVDQVEEKLNDFLLQLIEEYEEHPDTNLIEESLKKAKLRDMPDPLGTHLKLNCSAMSFEESLVVIENYLKELRAGAKPSLSQASSSHDDPMD